MNRPEPRLTRTAGGPRRRNQLGQAMGAKGIRTRRKLLQATETLLNTTPLRDLGVAQIVRVAGTSAATFYVYFNDVSEAVLALIGELTQSQPKLLALVAEPWEGESALDHAHEFVAAHSETWHGHAPAFRVRNLASDEGDQRFTQLRTNAVAQLIAVMAGRIQDRQAAGALPADLHPPSAAGALLAMIERIAAVQLPGDDGVTKPRLLHVAALFSVLLLGDGWRPPDAKIGWIRPAAGSPSAEAVRPPPAPGDQLNLHGQAMGAKGVRTRQRLVDATTELVRTRPLLGLSVAEISKAAQTSTSTFYLYFRDVPEVLLAAVAQVSQATPDLVELLAGDWAGDPEQRAHEFVARYIQHWQAHRGLFRACILAADEGDRRFMLARDASVRPLLDPITYRVTQCQAAGRLTPDLHPASAAAGVLAMIERMAATPHVKASGEGGGVTLETVTRATAYFLSVLMVGLPASATDASSPA